MLLIGFSYLRRSFGLFGKTEHFESSKAAGLILMPSVSVGQLTVDFQIYDRRLPVENNRWMLGDFIHKPSVHDKKRMLVNTRILEQGISHS